MLSPSIVRDTLSADLASQVPSIVSPNIPSLNVPSSAKVASMVRPNAFIMAISVFGSAR